MTEPFDALARTLGLVRRYRDGAGRMRVARRESLLAVLEAMGFPANSAAQAADSLSRATAPRSLPRWQVVEAGKPCRVPVSGGPLRWVLTCQDGSVREGRAQEVIALDPLPAGYHLLQAGAAEATLLAAPARLPLAQRGWGVTAPLYGLRPQGRGGLGDYADLGELARLLGRLGAGFLGINPVHAGFAEDPQAFSPYSPSSREWLATMHIADTAPEPPPDGALIDYPAPLAAKQAALRAEFNQQDPAFAAWRAAQGKGLEAFATHQALSKTHGPYWNRWPEPFHHPTSREVASFAAANKAEISFHAWQQWRAETQLAAAQSAARASGMGLGLYLDLAVGVHPFGAETWADPDLFAPGMSLGAPPDGFAPAGQVWNLAPMKPHELAARGFDPLARILRRQLRIAGMLRIDHILGFARTFWVPQGLPGVYVTMPRKALLAIIRIEAARAGAVIVGEDLGVVPRGLRSELARAGILGCRVAMFERDWNGDGSFTRPGDYDQAAIASFGSHDLPVWRGWRGGRDIDWREKLGEISAADAGALRRSREQEVAGFDTASGGNGALENIAGFLARTNAVLVAMQIEDILGAREQPNLPGTVQEHPNWRRRLTASPHDIARHPDMCAVAEIMSRRGR